MSVDEHTQEAHESAPTGPEASPVELRPPRCPRCDYDLTGTLEEPEQRCPECGRQWTVEELAIQQVADRYLLTRGQFVNWALAPGWIILILIAFSVLFSAAPIITLFFVAVAGLVAVLAIFNWSRDLYRVSFVRGRSGARRFTFVVSSILGLIGLNLLQFMLVGIVLVAIGELLK